MTQSRRTPRVVFYEKPGCLTNKRQKALLEEHGCRLEVRNLLTEPWTRERLLEFFGDRPVGEWFNRAAPRIRDGDVDPENLDRDSALALMLEEPLLIRRPLLDTPFGKTAGFDNPAILAALGIRTEATEKRHQDCARPANLTGCPEPK